MIIYFDADGSNYGDPANLSIVVIPESESSWPDDVFVDYENGYIYPLVQWAESHPEGNRIQVSELLKLRELVGELRSGNPNPQSWESFLDAAGNLDIW